MTRYTNSSIRQFFLSDREIRNNDSNYKKKESSNNLSEQNEATN